jgi:hypothetical protein
MRFVQGAFPPIALSCFWGEKEMKSFTNAPNCASHEPVWLGDANLQIVSTTPEDYETIGITPWDSIVNHLPTAILEGVELARDRFAQLDRMKKNRSAHIKNTDTIESIESDQFIMSRLQRKVSEF